MIWNGFVAPRAGAQLGEEVGAAASRETGLCGVGQDVEVQTHYLPGGWAQGFSVVEIVPDGYRVRRNSDRATFPEVFPANEVRPCVR